MATEAIIASLRRSRLQLLAPVNLSGIPLLGTLASISSEIVSCFTAVCFSFQRRNSRSLIQKIQIFAVFFQYLADSGFDSVSSTTMTTCFNELYLLLYHSKILLHYCTHSSKLWLLLQNHSVSGFFHVLNRDFSTLLDVLPINSLGLSDDIREQIELLKKQSSESTLFIDGNDETLRERLYSTLDGFEIGRVPNSGELRDFLVERLGIMDPKSCMDEIEFLEQQIVYYDCDLEPTGSVINGFIEIIRYCRFLFFGIGDDEFDKSEKQRKCFIAMEIGDTFRNMPNDFICSISLDLMKDPVIVSTGQTYDRSSIDSWIKAGHSTCPTTRQKLVDSSSMVPNRALSRLITHWCTATGTLHESDSVYLPNESLDSVLQTRASMEASKATVLILIQNLANGSESVQTVAAQELRLLTRKGNEKRLLIAQAGAIPHLRRLLKSENGITQEISVTAMLNLTIYKENRSLIMEENDCLESIVSILVSGLTMEARENAAATLLNLSSTEAYEKKIGKVDGCIESLAWLMQNGTPRGKHDVIKALYNISLHPDNCIRMVNSGGVSAIVAAMADEVEAERAAKVLALVANQSLGAEAIGREESAVAGLVKLMRYGTPKGKEHAVDALLQLCVRGGTVVVGKVVRTPAIELFVYNLRLMGTDRAKRKASSLALLLKKCRNTVVMQSGNREGSFRTNVTVTVPIFVQ